MVAKNDTPVEYIIISLHFPLLIIRKPTYVLGVGTPPGTDTQYVRRFTNDEECALPYFLNEHFCPETVHGTGT
jgi:hypothetical protein